MYCPASFQRTVNIVLSGFRSKTGLVYLDDVIVFSKTFDQHLDHVAEVMTDLQEAGFSLNLKKCDFFKNKVDYLGHVVRPGKLAVAQKKIKAIEELRLPDTQTHIKSFLGLCNVIGDLCRTSRASLPLNAFLKNFMPPTPAPLSPEAVESFNRLK